MSDVNAHSQRVHNPPSTSMEPIKHTNVQDQRARMAKVELETGIPGIGGLLPGMTKEYSGWDVYNNEARKVDSELVKDWTSNLNSLLLFAAIFAAVLTAFIIESKKLLEVDPADVMLSVMIFHTNNVANGTHTIYTQPEFIASSSAVTINCLFFASLSLSLVAALASVVALQWVGDYDAAITRGGSSPEDRAKRRQFQHAGVILWRMGEIIATIPLFLYSSVVLFLAGLILWMWIVNQVVGVVIAGGAGIAILFYGGTTMLAVAFVSAPFRTPLSRWIYSLLHLPLSLGYVVARPIADSSIRTWLEQRYYTRYHSRPLAPVGLIIKWLADALGFSHVLPWLEKRHLNGRLPSKREDREVENRKELGISALVWLSNQLSISLDSHDRLLLLASEIPTFRVTSYIRTLDTAPLHRILHFLSLNLFRKDINEEITAEDIHAARILARCYGNLGLRNLSPTSGMSYDADDTVDWYWGQGPGYRDVAYYIDQNFPEKYPNLLFLAFRDLPVSSDGEAGQIEGAIRLSRWRNKAKGRPEDWCKAVDFAFKHSSDTHFSYLFDEYTGPLWRHLGSQGSLWWSKMAGYLANEYEGPYRPSILRMQASVLPVLQDPVDLFRGARADHELLAHLKHLFQYPVPCPEHHDGEGDRHLLLHIFDGAPGCHFTTDTSAYTSVPLNDQWIHCLLTLWILPRDQGGRAMREAINYMDPQSFNQIMEMLEVVRNSQFAAQALLSDHCAGTLRNEGIFICPEDVMAISVCIKDTLPLPWDPRTAAIFPKLVDNVRELRDRMLEEGDRSAEEKMAAGSMVNEAVDGLYTCIATMLVFGRLNIRMLSCARTSKAFSPAVGYLAPYID